MLDVQLSEESNSLASSISIKNVEEVSHESAGSNKRKLIMDQINPFNQNMPEEEQKVGFHQEYPRYLRENQDAFVKQCQKMQGKVNKTRLKNLQISSADFNKTQISFKKTVEYKNRKTLVIDIVNTLVT